MGRVGRRRARECVWVGGGCVYVKMSECVRVSVRLLISRSWEHGVGRVAMNGIFSVLDGNLEMQSSREIIANRAHNVLLQECHEEAEPNKDHDVDLERKRENNVEGRLMMCG